MSRVLFSSGGKYVLTIGRDIVQLWDAGTGRELRLFSDTWTGAFLADSRLVATSDRNGMVRMFDIQSGSQLGGFATHNIVHDLSLSPDGQQVLIFGTDGKARLWELGSGRQQRIFKVEDTDSPSPSLLFSPDGKYVLIGEQRLKAAVAQAVEPYRTSDGGVRLENRFRFVVAVP